MRNSLIRLGTAVLGVAALAGCAAIAPRYQPPVSDVPANFATIGDQITSAPAHSQAWWEAFGDPVLDALIAEANADNRDLRAAVERVTAARARTSLSRAAYLPAGNVAARLERGEGGRDESAGAVDLRRAGFDASWELDLFGRLRSGVRAADARTGIAEATLADLRLTIAAEVARTYFELRGAQDRARLLERYSSDQQRIVEITQTRVVEGAATAEDASRAEAQLAADRAAWLAERERAARLEHAVAVLVGRHAGAWQVPQAPALQMLRLEGISVGDPAALLRRRPDIRAAERRLAATTAEIGVATAALFPQVRVSGFFGYAAGSVDGLISPANRSWQVMPSISWPLFDMGRVRAGIRASHGEARAALAEYEQTVLEALADTENAFGSYGFAQQRLAALLDQAGHARQAAELALVRFEEGETDYVGALDAARSARIADAALVEALVAQRIATVAVHKALGGPPML